MKNPFESEYYNIKNTCTYNKRLLIFTTIVTLLSTVFQYMYNCTCLDLAINIILCFCIITYNCINIYIAFAYIKEEDKRRSDLIDNALGTNFSSERTENYYTNEKTGILKIAANNFESCLYSLREIAYDYKHYWPKAVVIIAIYVLAALFGEQNIMIALLKLTIPFIVVTRCARMYYCKDKFRYIINEYRKLFGTKTIKASRRDSIIINLFTQYETTLSWGQVLLSDKAYQTLKSDIEKEWDGIRKDFSI